MEGYYETMSNIREQLGALNILYEQVCASEEDICKTMREVLKIKYKLEKDIRNLNEEKNRLHNRWIREHTYDPCRKMDNVDILMSIQKNGNIKGTIL